MGQKDLGVRTIIPTTDTNNRKPKQNGMNILGSQYNPYNYRHQQTKSQKRNGINRLEVRTIIATIDINNKTYKNEMGKKAWQDNNSNYRHKQQNTKTEMRSIDLEVRTIITTTDTNKRAHQNQKGSIDFIFDIITYCLPSFKSI